MEIDMEVLILAGGLGTRLQSVVSAPKCMAPINGLPFLDYQLNYLISQNIEKVYLSVGHQSEMIMNHYQDQYQGMNIRYVKESVPMGTGGAINLAFEKIDTDRLLVLNGDTMFPVDLKFLLDSHQTKRADCTIALKSMQRFDRYGAVETNRDNRILAFHEKQYVPEGWINGGIYLIERDPFLTYNDQTKFSIEKDYFEKRVDQLHFYGFPSDVYFIDIGIPDDYRKAQVELPKLFKIE